MAAKYSEILRLNHKGLSRRNIHVSKAEWYKTRFFHLQESETLLRDPALYKVKQMLRLLNRNATEATTDTDKAERELIV